MNEMIHAPQNDSLRPGAAFLFGRIRFLKEQINRDNGFLQEWHDPKQ